MNVNVNNMNACDLHIYIIESISDVITVLTVNIQDKHSDDW